MSNTVRDVINGRWKPQFNDVTRLRPIRAALDNALKAYDAVRERSAQLTQNKKLSPLGRLDDVRAFVSKSTAPVIHRARTVAKSARDDLVTWRTRLQPKAADPKDIAGAALAGEMRTYLRGLSKSAAAALLVSQNPDPALIQAVLGAPSFLSGIDDTLRQRVLDNYIARTHSNDLAQIAQVEEAVELLEAATGVVFSTAKSVAEFSSEGLFSAFIDKAAPVPAPINAHIDTIGERSEWQKRSDEFHENLLAEARTELAAI